MRLQRYFCTYQNKTWRKMAKPSMNLWICFRINMTKTQLKVPSFGPIESIIRVSCHILISFLLLSYLWKPLYEIVFPEFLQSGALISSAAAAAAAAVAAANEAAPWAMGGEGRLFPFPFSWIYPVWRFTFILSICCGKFNFCLWHSPFDMSIAISNM